MERIAEEQAHYMHTGGDLEGIPFAGFWSFSFQFHS